MSATIAGHQLYQIHNYTPTVPLALSGQAYSPLILKQMLVLQLPGPKSCHFMSFLICPYSSQGNLAMALPLCTACFPALEALMATLNINWGSGQLKAGVRSLALQDSILEEFHPACWSQQCLAQLGVLSLQLIINGQRYLVPCSQYPYGKPVCSGRWGPATQTGKRSHRTTVPILSCNNKSVTVAQQDGLGNFWRCWIFSGRPCAIPGSPWCTGPLVRVLQVSNPDPSSLQSKAPAGHMYHAITLWRIMRVSLVHSFSCSGVVPSLWVANKVGENKINFLKTLCKLSHDWTRFLFTLILQWRLISCIVLPLLKKNQ